MESHDIIRFNLNNVSMALSILCVIDCTLIPLLLVLLSVFNLLDDKLDFLHEVSEIIALYIMVPISSLCVTINFYQLKNFFLLLWGIFGIILFTFAHGHFQCFGENINEVLKEFHLVLSLFSIFSILSNNFVSQKLLRKRNLHYCCLDKHHRKSADDNEETVLNNPTDMLSSTQNSMNSQTFTNYQTEMENGNHCCRDNHDQNNDTIQNPNIKDKNYKKLGKSETELVCFLKNH